MRIQISVSVFQSPTKALGYANGEIEVPTVPKEHEAFPWPDDWITAKPTYFSPEQSRVSTVTATDSQTSVLLDGIVCESVAEARECAEFLEKTGGLVFWEY